jgi:hypothetical protein
MVYTVLALLQFFGMNETHESPQKNLPPEDVVNGSGDKQDYFDKVLDKFVQEYLMTTPDEDDDHLESDEALDMTIKVL